MRLHRAIQEAYLFMGQSYYCIQINVIHRLLKVVLQVEGTLHTRVKVIITVIVSNILLGSLGACLSCRQRLGRYSYRGNLVTFPSLARAML
jgi:hypothetical protein